MVCACSPSCPPSPPPSTLRLAGVPSRRLPTGEELCDGHERRVCVLLPELFEIYALRPARAGMATTLPWLSNVLEAYSVRTACLSRVAQGKALVGVPAGLWMLLRDGAALALLAHYYGGDAAAEGPAGVDLAAVSLMPASSLERLGNLRVAAPVLARMGVRFIINDAALATMRDDTADAALLGADDDAALLQVGGWSSWCVLSRLLRTVRSNPPSCADPAALRCPCHAPPLRLARRPRGAFRIPGRRAKGAGACLWGTHWRGNRIRRRRHLWWLPC